MTCEGILQQQIWRHDYVHPMLSFMSTDFELQTLLYKHIAWTNDKENFFDSSKPCLSLILALLLAKIKSLDSIHQSVLSFKVDLWYIKGL